jgi:hypothetical protein
MIIAQRPASCGWYKPHVTSPLLLLAVVVDSAAATNSLGSRAA